MTGESPALLGLGTEAATLLPFASLFFMLDGPIFEQSTGELEHLAGRRAAALGLRFPEWLIQGITGTSVWCATDRAVLMPKSISC